MIAYLHNYGTGSRSDDAKSGGLGADAPAYPVSFFAVPGITAFLPMFYDAIDQIHRLCQVSGAVSRDDKTAPTIDATNSVNASISMQPAPGTPVLPAPHFTTRTVFSEKCHCSRIRRFVNPLLTAIIIPLVSGEVRKSGGGSTNAAVPAADSGGGGHSGVVHQQDAGAGSSMLQGAYIGGNAGALSSSSLTLGGKGSSGHSLSTQSIAQRFIPIAPAPLGGQFGSATATPQSILPRSDNNSANSTTNVSNSTNGSSQQQQQQQGASNASRTSLGKTTSKIGSPKSQGVGGSGGYDLSLLSGIQEIPSRSEVRDAVEVFMYQIRRYHRDLNRVPRNKRKAFVVGLDGQTKTEWVKIELPPIKLPRCLGLFWEMVVGSLGWDKGLVPCVVVLRKPKNRIHFMQGEDDLLLRGLQLFGFDDLVSIQVHLLPCKTNPQLRNRLNNQRARRAPPNPVKEFCLRRITPFTVEEEEILRVGVMVYGDEFKSINQEFLKTRPTFAIKRVWDHIRPTTSSPTHNNRHE
ncbi:hypothetical protein EV182_005189 [Spiromyces aspiralis]|uniref:Uncharacterized protein n=1 Tax=Spiromyces aspiralis TaxID=68401 RepID=A0ACC1HAA8_9FUNG|nr:hypothetical protein EV182_005189 [Spiromyces aspiralis]